MFRTINNIKLNINMFIDLELLALVPMEVQSNELNLYRWIYNISIHKKMNGNKLAIAIW